MTTIQKLHKMGMRALLSYNFRLLSIYTSQPYWGYAKMTVISY